MECISNELFDAPNADAMILEVPAPPRSSASLPRAPKGLPAYLQSLYLTPLLTREQEQDLFRRYNYLKYKTANALRSVPSTSAMARLFGLIPIVGNICHGGEIFGLAQNPFLICAAE